MVLVTDEEKFIGQRIRDTSFRLNEYEEMISVNMAIISRLKERKMIPEDDPEYHEIMKIHKKNQLAYKNFLLNRMPGYLGYGRNKKLEEEFIIWIQKYLSKVRAEDKILKKYINSRINNEKDKKLLTGSNQVKDKRFWKFLDNFKKKKAPFESFKRNEKEESSGDQEE